MPRSTHACRFDVLIKRARSNSAELNICSLMFFVRNSVQTSWRACQSPSKTAWQTYRKKSRIRSGTVAPINFTVVSHAANTAVAPIMMRMPEPAAPPRNGASATRSIVAMFCWRSQCLGSMKKLRPLAVESEASLLPASSSRFTVDLRQVDTFGFPGEAQDHHSSHCRDDGEQNDPERHGKRQAIDRG